MKKITQSSKFTVLILCFLLATVSFAQVGIGTTAPNKALDVEVNSPADGIQINNIAGNGDPTLEFQVNGNSIVTMGIDDSDADKFKIGTTAITANTRMTIATNGNIGIGTINPATRFHYSDNTTYNNFHTMWDFNNATDAIGRVQSLSAANGSRGWFGITNYSGSALAANGLMGLALNANGTAAGVEGFSNSFDGYGMLAGFQGGTSFLANGWALFADGWAGGTTAWQNFSDARLKRNIVTIDGALEKVKQLRGVEYNYDNSNYPGVNLDTQTRQLGFIAQEVEEVFPNIVRESNLSASSDKMNNNTSREQSIYKVKSLSYTLIVPVLVEAIKEQQSIIESQNSKLDMMEQKLQLLEAKVNQLLNSQN